MTLTKHFAGGSGEPGRFARRIVAREDSVRSLKLWNLKLWVLNDGSMSMEPKMAEYFMGHQKFETKSTLT